MAVMISSHQHSILKSHPHMQRAVRIVVALPTCNYHKILQPKVHLQFCCILASISEIDETAYGLRLIAAIIDRRLIQMSTSVASNDKDELWQTVDRSYDGFAISNLKDKEKFMPTRFYNTPVRPDMYVCASIRYQVPGTSYRY